MNHGASVFFDLNNVLNLKDCCIGKNASKILKIKIYLKLSSYNLER